MKGAGKGIRHIVAVILSAAVVTGMSGVVYSDRVYATQVEEQPEQVAETVQEPTAAKPQELDLGEYQSSMEIGQRQLLTVTVLPLGANASLSYQSSDPSVAEINGMGRITALGAGVAQIQVSCAGTEVSASFSLQVTESVESRSVQVTELDLGDCPKELTAGSTALLTVSVIPAEATDYELSYQSDHPEVVTVNALGRITGVSPGVANITVSCGMVSASFAVTVLPEETEPAEEKIPVSDIEIGDYKEELEVDGTVTLSATVLPEDATDSKVTYRSSDPAVATVKSSGEVKGIAPGSVTIYVTAGGVTREARFTVKVSTKATTMNQDYLVCKPGDTCQLEGNVSPADAVQTLTYRTLDKTVAEVTEDGLVRAVGTGNTSILVTNGDLQTSVTVIVNEGVQETGEAEEGEDTTVSGEKPLPEKISVKEYPVIHAQMLEQLYETDGTLQVQGKGYRLLLKGSQIVNYHNELETDLKLIEEPYGYSFTVNGGKRLCGTVQIKIDRDSSRKGYLYLYNDKKEAYELVGTTDGAELTIDTAGTYRYSAKKLSGFSIPPLLIVIGLLAILAGSGIYIGTKKRYWFW